MLDFVDRADVDFQETKFDLMFYQNHNAKLLTGLIDYLVIL